MYIAFSVYLLILGLILIVKGGDIFVDAATWIARISGIPQFIIGATIVSIATTLPEMIVSFIAASDNMVDMALGNAIGSVTANIGLIMSFAIICIPMTISRREYMFKSLLMLIAALVIVVFGRSGTLGILPGIALLIIFALAMRDSIVSAKAHMSGGSRSSGGMTDFSERVYGLHGPGGILSLPLNNKLSTFVAARPATFIVIENIIKFIVGIIAIIVGSDLLVDNGSRLAAYFGVSERIIAVTIVAIGTSLPELVTTVTAVAKRQGSLSIGNIIGANIIDLTLIPPICALIAGRALPVSTQMSAIDLPASLVVGAIAVIPTLITKRFTRLQGFLLIAVYIGYVVITVSAV